MTTDVTNTAPETVWLWPEGAGLRWWSAHHTRLLADLAPAASPSAQLDATDWIALRDRQVNWPLDVALRESLAALLAAALQRHSTLRLHLHPALPQCWQQFPFEWLRADGAALHSRLAVNRMSTGDWGGDAPLAPHRDCVVLDLLPATEPLSPARAVPNGMAQIISGTAAVRHFLARADLPNLAALCVVAHGTENGTAPALRLPDGTPWTLPVERGLPPLVILLACGDDRGNLMAEAQRLLAAGAQTVLAALGRPTLTGGGHFLREFLPRWRDGERLDDVLRDLAATADGATGARRLLLFGRGDLRCAELAQLREHSDVALIALIRASTETAVSQAALAELVQRLTWRSFVTAAPLDNAVTQLRAALGVARHDDTAQRWLCARLQPLEATLPALSRAWIAPLLALLTEAYSHSGIEQLKQVRYALERLNLPSSAPLLHYWSKLHYRHGQYALALQDVAAGLMTMQRQELVDASGHYQPRSFGLIGHLFSLLIELNLPEPGARLGDALDEALARSDAHDAPLERYKLLDRRARCALRLGQPRSALAHYRQKYHAAIEQFGKSGERELAGVVYAAAWSDTIDAVVTSEHTHWLALAREYLEQLDFAALGSNADALYLLRAGAMWGWLRRDDAMLRLVQTAIPLLTAHLHGVNGADPGPPGVIFSVLHLAARDGVMALPEIPAWDEIRVGLERGRYFLELAALGSLMGDAAAARDLERFQRQRQLLPGAAFPEWFENGLLADWATLCTQRMVRERSVLNAGNGANPQRLLETGLLPL